MRAPLGVCFIALAVVVVGAQSPAPDLPPQRPTFRGGINYVKVDMYASRDGVALTDLQRDDIEVLEDGKPQTIKDFEHIKIVSGTPQDLRREPNTVDESRQMAADARARVFVIFLDTLHTSVFGSANMRQPLIRFIDRLLGPDDLIAVMTPEMSAGDITFGRKTTVISKMLEREWAWGRRDRAPRPRDDDGCRGCGTPRDEGTGPDRLDLPDRFDHQGVERDSDHAAHRRGPVGPR